MMQIYRIFLIFQNYTYFHKVIIFHNSSKKNHVILLDNMAFLSKVSRRPLPDFVWWRYLAKEN